MEAVLPKKGKTELATDPEMATATTDDADPSHNNTVCLRKIPDFPVVQQRHPVFGITQPGSPLRVVERCARAACRETLGLGAITPNAMLFDVLHAFVTIVDPYTTVALAPEDFPYPTPIEPGWNVKMLNAIYRLSPYPISPAPPNGARFIAINAGAALTKCLRHNHVIAHAQNRPVSSASCKDFAVRSRQQGKVLVARWHFDRNQIAAAKSIQARPGSGPDIAFTILEQGGDRVAREPVSFGK